MEGVSFYLKKLELYKVARILKLFDNCRHVPLFAKRILNDVEYHSICLFDDLQRCPFLRDFVETLNDQIKDWSDLIWRRHFVPDLEASIDVEIIGGFFYALRCQVGKVVEI